MRGITVLKWMIYFVLTMVGVVLIQFLSLGEIWPFNGEKLNGRLIVQYLFVASCIFVFCAILYEMLKIIKNAEAKEFFNYSNVKSLKSMSLGIWYLVFVKIVKNFIENGGVFIEAPEIVLVLVAMFVQVLSYIFSEAYKLKESEEELKEENKLVI